MNVPDYMVRGGNTYRIVSDWRGSVRAVVDANAGTVIETIDYDAWGNVTSFSDTTCGGGPGCFYFQPFGFAGGIYDKDAGFVRFGARDYDASVGRWTQKDASGFGGGSNFYAYCANDPVNLVDPNGREPVTAQDMLNELEPTWIQQSRAALLGAFLGSIGGSALGLGLDWLTTAVTSALTPTGLAASSSTMIAVASACGDDIESLPALPAPSGYNPWVGDIISTTTEVDMTLYRVWGDGSSQAGQWLAPTLPETAAEARATLALPAQNSAAWVSEVLVPAGTQIQFGLAAAANGQPGGAWQVQLLGLIPISSFGPGSPLE
jgi:RHS repeat-associated protein